MVAAVVLTIGVVVGMDALARLAAEPDGIPAETATVQVRDGETLSAVASRIAPGAPIGRVVDRIMELNDMPGVSVRAGQTLLAPVSLSG
ncbi:LysM peptidoglycan-binding domain-containing protein [Rhodococcus xishaensis]|uniref:LysM peptidoglycan-binding domain-containing protein n=1 Tax=Rhodococcus xishaensis TaxID=2487364 RepID=A0A3S3BL75_9NOCA|nr:LysM peptidoglycan-binding domain-containing protein [Rhodococcus xishaensis]